MKHVTLKFEKTHEDAKLPFKKRDEDTGWDVFSIEDKVIPARGSAVVDVGLNLAYITPGCWIMIGTRSGMGFKHGLMCHAGIVDNLYRGGLGIKLYNLSDTDYQVQKGDRIAQLIVFENFNTTVEFGEVENTDRGDNGFGSSGR